MFHSRKLSFFFVFCFGILNIWLSFTLLSFRNSSTCHNDFNKTIKKKSIITLTKSIASKSNETSDKQHHHRTNLAFSNINLNLGRWDNQRLYKFYDFALVGTNTTRSSTVCLATQSSVDRLHFLPQVAQHWNGSISIAVYAESDEEFYVLQLYVTFLLICNEIIATNVNFHLAVLGNKVPSSLSDLSINILDELKLNRICHRPEVAYRKLLNLEYVEKFRYRIKNVYPQNHLRNLARKGCQSENVFITDVDIIPSMNLEFKLAKFLRTNYCKNLCAFVIPTYELDRRVKFPETKYELIELQKHGLARPFHEKVFIYNQFATNFSLWQKDVSEGDIRISHNVENYEFLYEPFYVASDRVPPHDERFLGYGFTRNTQVYEMFIAGFVFHVITPAFTCHWGLQQKKYRPAWRELQNSRNGLKFQRFHKEVLVRFKETNVTVIDPKKVKKRRG